jgi:UDP-N-acetylglucosamine--dolichyl-phosphate N-acetylglucosaminephosphotransferase
MAIVIPPIVIYLIAFFVPLFLTFLGLPFHIKYMLKKEIYGVDVHKKDKPKIAEIGGIIILIAIIITSIIAIILINDSNSRLAIGIFCLTITIAGIIGLVDDFKRLSAILKPALLLLASIPIIASGMYIPEPYLPFVGQTRLTIVYIILLPFVIAIPSNAVNMLDVFNGSMATTTIIVLIATFIANIIMFGFNINTLLTNIFILMTIATLIAFWAFNRYPAKVFGGDTGSLTIGAALGAIAVLGRLEVVVIIAMIPFIMNAFGIISSVRGLFERKDMARPTQMTKDWKIESTENPKAPITLVGLVIQKGPLHEKDVVKSFNILTVVSGIFAVIAAVLIKLVM